ncbi:MAG: hypothetical protein JXR81_06945 [Candidatus Goldbacteria bacterium]|nr:hypothetical protein [Candidatus Goldiibacteriota bacterium]
MKKYLLIPFLLFVVVGVILFLKQTTHWPVDKLSDLQRRINSQVNATNKTGQDSKISFAVSESNVVLIISPPYAKISDIGKDILNPVLFGELQSFVDSQETGHLFYVKNGQLIDHRLLSGLVEPILGMSMRKDTVFLISRKSTSGRPVRIEILNQ